MAEVKNLKQEIARCLDAGVRPTVGQRVHTLDVLRAIIDDPAIMAAIDARELRVNPPRPYRDLPTRDVFKLVDNGIAEHAPDEVYERANTALAELELRWAEGTTLSTLRETGGRSA